MWEHKKEGKGWKSKYEKDSAGERIFILVKQPKGPSLSGFRRIAFESWQQAKKLGWVKSK